MSNAQLNSKDVDKNLVQQLPACITFTPVQICSLPQHQVHAS